MIIHIIQEIEEKELSLIPRMIIQMIHEIAKKFIILRTIHFSINT